ncbi:MAG TPA: LysR family transcriptional regulator [Burkholderiaceae bacterium]|nr:LysR family transcriptional regulator [Burkholderiaceae bacterium]
MRERAIELRLWRQFVGVAEELHFGRAAARLHMTQPPLTQAIAQLEGILGVRLFDRTKRSVQLTPAGAALLPEVRDLLARAAALPAQALAAASGESGRLRLAFVSTAGFSLLPEWLQAFRALHPNVQMELIEATGDVQLQLFEQGGIDAGFMLHSPGFAPAVLAHCRVWVEPLVMALPAQHPLAKGASLRLRDALKAPLVIFPRRIVPSLHDAIFGLYHAAGSLPNVAQEAIQMQTIVNLVSAGLGVAWVPHSVTQFQRPGVVYRSITAEAGRGSLQCETSLVWDPARGNPTVERFVAFARQHSTTPQRRPRPAA